MFSRKQIKQVGNYLNKHASDASVSEEILDHFLSEIENRMISGESFEVAFQNIKNQFLPEEIKKVSRNKQWLVMMKQTKIWSFPIAASLVLMVVVLKTHSQSVGEWSAPIPDSELVRVSSDFGLRQHPINQTKKMHWGVDLVAKAGTTVRSVASGKVLEVAVSNTGYGNTITVEHNDSIQTRYSQLQDILVKEGDEVGHLDVIGTVGSSGLSTGPHLHFEVIKNGQKVNPELLGFLKD